MRWLLVLFVLMLHLSPAWAGEEPSPSSWFSYEDSTGVDIDVCNVMKFKDGRTAHLSEFAPAAGALWSREHGRMDCYMFPVKVAGVYVDRSYSLSLVCGRRIYKMEWASWQESPGQMYALVAIPNAYRLKDVTGFILEGPKRYELKLESKLR